MSHLPLPFVLLLAAIAGTLAGCAETVDDFNSELICQDYCSKKFACDDYNPTSDDTNVCVTSCRDTIENECGNDDQSGVNDVIGGCVDLSCDDFWGCMVFDAAPECLGFIES